MQTKKNIIREDDFMSNLSCNARECISNQGGMCKAGQITIQSQGAAHSIDTYCSNYQDKNVSGVNSMNDVNYVGQISAGFVSMYDMAGSPEIACNANTCIYNLGGRCESRQVNIQADGGEGMEGTMCNTFTN